MHYTRGWSSSAPELSDGQYSRGKLRYASHLYMLAVFYHDSICTNCTIYVIKEKRIIYLTSISS
jgi:hypothetical protein